MADITCSTCENPQYPSWMWRYNRNKKLTRFEPWYTRVERWPPQYRHMGLPDNFRFHPVGPNEDVHHFLQLGANYANKLVADRSSGFGNAALGNTPGPAPPRLIVYEVQNPYPQDELYKVNEIHNISAGMSLLDYTYLPPPVSDDDNIPLNPRQYLEKTLNQMQTYPGTFPHYNAPIPSVSHRLQRVCSSKSNRLPLDPLQFWLEYKRNQENENMMNNKQTARMCAPPFYLPQPH